MTGYRVSVLFAAFAGYLSLHVATNPAFGQSAPSIEAKLGRELVVSVERLFVRELPHKEAPIFATLTKGSVVFEVRRIGNWVEVRGVKEKIGWAENSGLSLGAAKSVQQPKLLGLTAAAIASLIIQQSRQAYYATGRPCACPDDIMGNGRTCGQNSAYSKPGGARPKCFPLDVSEREIEAYRSREN